ncbi:efflux RND transporter permease subunit [bacterium]|nr:efflux RND transporter permease subunit [bacterium]
MNENQLIHIAGVALLLLMVASRLPGFSIRRPVALSMIVTAFILMGLVGLRQLPMELMPNISYGQVTIFINVRGGMPPPEVERLITKPVEAAMSTVSKLKNIVSTSKKHKSIVTLEFEPGTNMNLATLETREKFLRVKGELPKSIERPVIAHYEESDAPVVIAALTSLCHSPEELRKLVEEGLKDRLLRIPGVANVEIGGGRERKILVHLDKRRLVALGLSVKQIIGILEKNNLNMQVGSLDQAEQLIGLRTQGAFKEIREIEQIGVAVTNKAGLVRLQDIAVVQDDFMEAETHSRLNSKSAVTLYIQKESLANVVHVVERVKLVLLQFENGLDEQIQLFTVADQGRSIQEAIRAVKMTLFYGMCLVVLILGFFLSKTVITRWLSVGLILGLTVNLLVFYLWRIPLTNTLVIIISVFVLMSGVSVWQKDIRPALMVAGSIPVSLLITLVMMYLEQVALNVISLSGLVLGIGLLVDNSIVVLENIDRFHKKYHTWSKSERVVQAAKQMMMPMIGGTLTTIAVFLPFSFLQKQTQLLYAGIAFTVTTTLLASLFTALALIPALAYYVPIEAATNPPAQSLRGSVTQFLEMLQMKSAAYLGKIVAFLKRKLCYVAGVLLILGLVLLRLVVHSNWGATVFVLAVAVLLITSLLMIKHYRWYLRILLQHKFKMTLLILCLFLGALFIFQKQLPKDFLAASEQSEFTIYVELPSGVRLDISDQVVKEVEKRIAGLEKIQPMLKNVSSRVEGWSSKIYVTLKPRAQRSWSTQEVIEYLRPRLEEGGEEHDAFIYFSEPRQGKEIFVELYGYQYQTLAQLAMQMASKMSKVEALSDVKVRYRPGRPEAKVHLLPKRVALMGLDNQDIGETVHAQLRGLHATSFYDQQEEIETIVRLEPKQCETIAQLKMLMLASPKGFHVPLEHFSDLRFGLSPSEIWHRNKSRMIQVSANLGKLPLETAAQAVQTIIRGMTFPEDYYADIGGDYENMVQANRSFWQALTFTVILIFIVLACLFESLRQPFIIMITVLLSVIGAIAALVVTNSTVTLGVLIGMLMLGGIVVNNGIILIDRMNKLKRQFPKIAVARLVIWAGRQRIRPIFMTTATTLFGLLPMALDCGESAVLWSPLAITVMGGLLSSTLLTLFILPGFYLILEEFKVVLAVRGFTRRWRLAEKKTN